MRGAICGLASLIPFKLFVLFRSSKAFFIFFTSFPLAPRFGGCCPGASLPGPLACPVGGGAVRGAICGLASLISFKLFFLNKVSNACFFMLTSFPSTPMFVVYCLGASLLVPLAPV